MPVPDVELVTCGALAREIGVTDRAVRAARRLDPARVKVPDGSIRYDRAYALDLWSRDRRHPPTRTNELSVRPPPPVVIPSDDEGGEGTIVDERAAGARAKIASARLAELRYSEEVRQLVPLDEIVDLWGRALSQIRSAVLAVPSRARIACPGPEAGAVLDRVDALLREALTRAGEIDHEGGSGGSPQAEQAEDSA